MAIFQDKTFRNETVRLDGNRYQRCQFENCDVVYGGGIVPVLAQCNFTGETFRFEGPALRTLQLLQGFAHPESGLQNLVRGSFPALFDPEGKPTPPLPPMSDFFPVGPAPVSDKE